VRLRALSGAPVSVAAYGARDAWRAPVPGTVVPAKGPGVTMFECWSARLTGAADVWMHDG